MPCAGRPRLGVAVLGEDAGWALTNIPLFEAANATLQEVYYFRWRSFKSHIHPTGDHSDGIDWVVTEFSPNVQSLNHLLPIRQ